MAVHFQENMLDSKQRSSTHTLAYMFFILCLIYKEQKKLCINQDLSLSFINMDFMPVKIWLFAMCNASEAFMQ